MNTYCGNCRSLEYRIDMLKRQVKDIESERDSLQWDCERLRGEIVTLRATIRRTRAEFSEIMEAQRYMAEPQQAIAEIVLDEMSSGRITNHLIRMDMSNEEFLRQLDASGLCEINGALAEQAEKAKSFARTLNSEDGQSKDEVDEDD